MAVVKRRSNSASPLDLGKALKFFFPTGLSRQQIWNKGTCEEIVIQYEDFLMEMILLSVRPTKTWILGACEKTFQKCDKDICGSFAQRFSEVASFCHRKKLRMKTGQKFPPAIRRIVKAMSKESEKDPQGLGEKLLAHAKKRTLEKKISIASTPSPKRRKKAATPLASSAPARETSVEELYAGLLQSSDQLLQQKSEEPVFVSSGEEGHDQAHLPLPSSSAAGPALPVQGKGLWFDPMLHTFVRRGDAAGDFEVAECKAGDQGFVLARFKGEDWITTEMPTMEWEKLLKAEPKKAKAKGKAKAKAAGVLKRPASILPSEPAAPAEPNSGNFVKEYRTKTNAFAIRKKWKDGTKDFKRQIIELKHRDTWRFSKQELATMADQVMEKLRNGENELDVVAWAKEKLKERD
jgi:hypothetical protein